MKLHHSPRVRTWYAAYGTTESLYVRANATLTPVSAYGRGGTSVEVRADGARCLVPNRGWREWQAGAKS